MKTHQERIFLLDRYFSGEMTEKEKKEFLNLINEDSLIEKEFNETKDLFENIGSAESLELKEKIEKIYALEASNNLQKQFNLFSKRSNVAVAAIIVSLLIVSVFLICNTRQTTDIKNQLVENGIEIEAPFINTPLNSRLETLIESNFRNEVIVIQTPTANAIVDQFETLTYSWRKAQPGQITINIYDVGDNNILRENCSVDGIKIHAPGKRGVYYWVIETEEEIIEIGRFYVR